MPGIFQAFPPNAKVDDEPISIIDTEITFQHCRVFLETDDIQVMRYYQRFVRGLHQDTPEKDQQ